MRRSTGSTDRSYRSKRKSKSPPRGKPEKRENFYCDYCKQQFLSKGVYHDHCKSEFHKEKVSFVMKACENNVWLCHSCEKGFDSKVTLDQHCLMLRHQGLYRVDGMPKPGQTGADMAKSDIKEPTLSSKDTSSDKDKLSGQRSLAGSKKYFCLVCDVDCLNSSNHRIHLESWRHRAAVDRQKEVEKEAEEKKNEAKTKNSSSSAPLKLDGKLPFCYMCNIMYNTERGYIEHLEEERHYKKIVVMRSPYNCSVCKIRVEKQAAFCSHLASRGHIERSAKEKPDDNKGDVKFKKAFQKAKSGKSGSPDTRNVEYSGSNDHNVNEDLRLQLMKGQDGKSNLPVISMSGTDSSAPLLVDYRHDSTASLRSENERSNLREQLMKERDEEWGKYKKLEEEYRRLCVDEEYIRRRLTFYDEMDPRRTEDVAVLQKIQRSLGDINAELIFRDKMIQEKENFILGASAEEKQPPATSAPSAPVPAPAPVPVKTPPNNGEEKDNRAVVVDYFHNSGTGGDQGEVNKKDAPVEKATKGKVEESENVIPKTSKKSEKRHSSGRRSQANAVAEEEQPVDKEKYLVQLISDSIQKDREKLVKRLMPELEHLDGTTKHRILKVVLDKDTEAEAPGEKERRSKSSKRKHRSKERQSSLADELQEAALRMLHDQHGKRPNPSVLIEQQRQKLFGKEGGRSSSKRRRSQSSDDSSDSSDSSQDHKSRRKSSRSKRKSEPSEKDKHRSSRDSKKEDNAPFVPQVSSQPGSTLTPHSLMLQNQFPTQAAMLIRAGLAAAPGGPLSLPGAMVPQHGLPVGFPGVYPGGGPPPASIPPPGFNPLSSMPFMSGVGANLSTAPAVTSKVAPVAVKDEALYPDLPPLQSATPSSSASALDAASATPSSRSQQHSRRHLPTPPPAGEGETSPRRSQQDQLNEIIASGVLDKIGAGAGLNVVDLLREQLANFDKARTPSDAGSHGAEPLFPSVLGASQSNNSAPIKSILKKRATEEKAELAANDGGGPSARDDADVEHARKDDSCSGVGSGSLAALPLGAEGSSGYRLFDDRAAASKPLHSQYPASSGLDGRESYPTKYEARPDAPMEASYSRYEETTTKESSQHDEFSRGYPPADKGRYAEDLGRRSPKQDWRDNGRAAYEEYERGSTESPYYGADQRSGARHDRPVSSGGQPFHYGDDRSARYDEASARREPSDTSRSRDHYPSEYRSESGSRRSYPPERIETAPYVDRRYGPPTPARRGLPPAGYGSSPRRGRPLPRP